MIFVTLLSAVVALGFAILFLVNLSYFGRSPASFDSTSVPSVSVLIPARNEARRIGPLLESVSASAGVRFEICVLDDQSEDDTARIVNDFAVGRNDVRLITGRPVPSGWNGKQFACHQLAEAAAYDELVFIDADVSLASDALSRAISMRRSAEVDLLSGFPRQRTGSLGEALLIPLIHLVLLCYLPFIVMRFSNRKSAAAGCGQFFSTTRAAYHAAGGHAAIRTSMHDGITLPRSYRAAGLRTDLFDASDVASCRMYESFQETWRGLSKNAHEGFANMPLLLGVTVVLYLQFIHAAIVLAASFFVEISAAHLAVATVSLVVGYLPRTVCCLWFDRSWAGCVLNPLAIALFLLIQWEAWWNRLRGRGVEWRRRSYEASVPT